VHIVAFAGGGVLILLALVDGFEAILVTRRVTHRFRFARLFFRSTWRVWRSAAGRFAPGNRREAFLSIFGPLSLLGLFSTWVFTLILGFALVFWAEASSPRMQGEPASLFGYVYMSGVTFFTLGYGDITPTTVPGRLSAVVEAGIGFGFLAVIISYLPVLYQAASRREVSISLLDARAGSPPSAGQILLRAARSKSCVTIDPFLAEWERWAAELLESHLSFPVLSYYRSQHGNQSWLAALTAVLDASALLVIGARDNNPYQAQLTFAMARHAAVDLALILKISPRSPSLDRLDAAALERLLGSLRENGVELRDGHDLDERLAELRAMYEPFVEALSRHFLMPLPPFSAPEPVIDNWQRSAWMKRTPGIGDLPGANATDEHF
jgi:hypothetical protein